jgi:hypothetical protein
MDFQSLLEALNASQPTRWRDVALAELVNRGDSLEREFDSTLAASRDELLQTYRIRLEHVRKHRIDATGIEEFLEALANRPPTSRIRGASFLGSDISMYVFWDDTNDLIGCITVKGKDKGVQHLKFAMGDST